MGQCTSSSPICHLVCITTLDATSEKLQIRQARNALTALRNKFRRLLPFHTTENDLQVGSLEAITVPNDTNIEFRSQLRLAVDQVMVHLRVVRKTFARVRMRVVEKPARLREAVRERENDLPRLLANSAEAMVAVNMKLRFVAANEKALDVFGISQKNMTKFSMDAFLPRDQILPFDESGALLIGQKEWHGECMIRRLDGSLRLAEFIFVATFVPFLHLCMFRNDRKWQREKRFAA